MSDLWRELSGIDNHAQGLFEAVHEAIDLDSLNDPDEVMREIWRRRNALQMLEELIWNHLLESKI